MEIYQILPSSGIPSLSSSSSFASLIPSLSESSYSKYENSEGAIEINILSTYIIILIYFIRFLLCFNPEVKGATARRNTRKIEKFLILLKAFKAETLIHNSVLLTCYYLNLNLNLTLNYSPAQYIVVGTSWPAHTVLFKGEFYS